MNHPIKRFKADDLERSKVLRNTRYDLYAGQNCSEASGSNQGLGDGVKSEWKGDDSKNPNGGKENRGETDGDKNSQSENLFTSEGLAPSFDDLNKIFDNSDDNSNDDHVSGEVRLALEHLSDLQHSPSTNELKLIKISIFLAG